jgi:hypothetical protein
MTSKAMVEQVRQRGKGTFCCRAPNKQRRILEEYLRNVPPNSVRLPRSHRWRCGEVPWNPPRPATEACRQGYRWDSSVDEDSSAPWLRFSRSVACAQSPKPGELMHLSHAYSKRSQPVHSGEALPHNAGEVAGGPRKAFILRCTIGWHEPSGSALRAHPPQPKLLLVRNGIATEAPAVHLTENHGADATDRQLAGGLVQFELLGPALSR